MSGIDLICDGHSHSELPEGLQVGETLIAHTGCYRHFLGKVTLDIKNKKIISKKAELLNAAGVAKLSAPDKKISAAIEKIDSDLQKYLDEVVAESDRALTAERKFVRHEETELGNLLADSFKWKAGADIGFLDGGNIRESLPAGKIMRRDVFAVLPFPNTLVKVEISGKILHELLEFGLKDYPKMSSVTPHTSGITFSFDCRKDVGHRVENIFVGGEVLDEEKMYTLATSDFLANGGDGFTMLKNSKLLETFDVTNVVVTEYLQKVGIKNIEVGRVKNLNVLPAE